MTQFTKEEKTSIFELLGLPQGGTLDWYDYSDLTTGLSTSVPIGQQIDFSLATNRLDAILTAIGDADDSGDDGRRIAITALINNYDQVNKDVATIGPGGAGLGAEGARYNPDQKRGHLRHLIQDILGFQLHHTHPHAFTITIRRS